MGHGCHKEGQDGAEGGEAQRQTKETAIQKVDGHIVFQIAADIFFKRGEGKHERILPFRILLLDRGRLFGKIIKTNVRSFLL